MIEAGIYGSGTVISKGEVGNFLGNLGFFSFAKVKEVQNKEIVIVVVMAILKRCIFIIFLEYGVEHEYRKLQSTLIKAIKY